MFQHSRPWEPKRLARKRVSHLCSVNPPGCWLKWNHSLLAASSKFEARSSTPMRSHRRGSRLVLGSPPSTYQIYSNISSSNCRRCIKILSSIIAWTWPPTSTKPLNHLKPIFWPGQASLKSLGSTCSASEFGARSFRHPHWPPAGAPIESRASLRTCLAPVASCRPLGTG